MKILQKIPKYEQVLREWKEEVQEKNNYENIKKLPIIQELIADLAPDIFSLIREQRLKVLTIGKLVLKNMEFLILPKVCMVKVSDVFRLFHNKV